jgi:Ricin-type beta-trefoil lectin domain
MRRSSWHVIRSIGISSLVLAGSTLGLAHAQAGTVAAKTTFPLQPYGTSLIIETTIDPNFCLEDSTSSEGTPVDVSQCADRDNQHWTFLQSTDNSIVIADGSGQCLGDKTSVSSGIVVGPCNFGNSEHFLVSASRDRDRDGKHCLTYAQARQNAGVFFKKCGAPNTDQNFMLAR